MGAKPIAGRWFDGRSSLPRTVGVVLERGERGPVLALQETGRASPSLTLPARDVGWPEAWSDKRSPRAITVDLDDAGTLEVDDAAALREAFAQAGGRAALSQRMQTRWSVFLAVLAAAAIGLGAFYRWGTPWAATLVTAQVPLAWEVALSQRAMADLDAGWLKPTKLPPERQAQLRARFDAIVRGIDPSLKRYRGYEPHFELLLRSGFGANAFALPGGTIVMTDGIVEEASRAGLGDEALDGVLAHEIGHVLHRHTTRLVVEQAVLNVGLGLALGDVSSFVSIAGSALTGLAYRRGHETEADCFALASMRATGRPAAPMADLLLAMEKHHGSGPKPTPSLATILSSHPATQERALALKAGQSPECRPPR